MADGAEQCQDSPVEKQEADDDGQSGLLSCRLFAVIAGAVFMALVVLFGVPKDEQRRGLSTAARHDHPAMHNVHQPGAWSNFSGSFSLADGRNAADRQNKTPGTQKGQPTEPRPLLCVVSRSLNNPIQFPRKHCTHIVYKDVAFNPTTGKFTPVNSATFVALRMLVEVTRQRALMAVANLEQHRAPDDARRLAAALVKWTPASGFHGVAALGIDTASDKLPDLGPLFKELHNALKPEKLEFLAAVHIRDWDIPSGLVVGRLAAIAPHLDYLVLETHFGNRYNSCHIAYSSVFYSTGAQPSPSVPIGQALSWMTSLLMEQRQYVTTCFSINMGAVVFRDATEMRGSCSGSDVVSYMQVCKGGEWRPSTVANLDALSVLRLGHGRVESHEDDPLLSSKVSHALANYPRACVVAYDVDLDDYEGQCDAEPFARLRNLRRAEVRNDPQMAAQSLAKSPNDELKKRCMPPGSGNKRPLVCVLSDRIDVDRNVSKLFCTHIVLSLRRYGRLDALKDITKEYVAQLRGAAPPGVCVLVAPHERALEQSHEGEAVRLAEATAVQLKGKQLDGLAFLHVARTSAALVELGPALEVLHETYKAANLCLALDLQILDPNTPAEEVGKSLSLVAKHVDLLVVNTHYPGRMGPCRAVPLASAVQPARSCIPTVATDTAVQWLKDVSENGLTLVCLSVDLRALRFRAYGTVAPFGSCRREEALDFPRACTGGSWTQVHNNSRDSPMWQDGYNLQTYETASSLTQRVRSLLPLPNAGVAVFNFDYEDYAGVCNGGVPQARLMALRAALDEENITAQTTLTLETPDRPLVCVLSATVRNESRVPSSHCTHLVHEGARYSVTEEQLVIPENTVSLAANRSKQRHLVGLNGNEMVELLMTANDRDRHEIAARMASAVLAAKMQGLAILNFNRTSKTIESFGSVLEVIRSVFAKELTIIFGAEVLDFSLPAEIMGQRLTKAAKHVDIFILQTHYRRPRGYCRISYPSTYRGDTPLVTLSAATAWARAMETTNRVCVSYTLGVLQFQKGNAMGPVACDNVTLLDRADACDEKDWEVDANNTKTLSVVRKKDKFIQTFESPEFLAEKVSRTFSENPGSCVALFNVDLEDATGNCGSTHARKFARLAVVAEKYIELDSRTKSKHQLLPMLTKVVPNDTAANLAGYLPHFAPERLVGFKARTTVYRPDILGMPEKRPFVCLFSPSWTNASVSPVPSRCTHVVLSAESLDAPNLTATTSDRGAALERLSRGLGRGVKLYVRLQGWRRDIAAKAQAVQDAMRLSYAQGVALTDIRIASTEAAQLALGIQALMEQMPKDMSLILGLEMSDYDEAGQLLSQRLAPLYEYADVVVLQTHLRTGHSWPFCRTTYASLFDHPSDDSCLQTPPAVTALSWMKLLQPFSVPTCLSLNMAAVKFRASKNATPEASCEDALETNDVCTTQEWPSAAESKSKLAAYRYKDGFSVTMETAELLREKLSRAHRLYPRFCVALYNVDVDAEPCEGSDLSFARVAQIADAAQYKHRKPTTHEPRGRDSGGSQDDDSGPRTAVQNATSSRALVCILSASALNMETFPMRLCSYVVYTRRVTPGAPPQPFVPQNDPKFSKFMRRCVETESNGLVAVTPSMLATLFTNNSTLVADALNGVMRRLADSKIAGLAVFATPSADLQALASMTQEAFKLLKDKFKMVVGVHVMKFDAPVLKELSKSSHLLVLFTHSMLRGSNCTVTAPSSLPLTPSHYELMKQISTLEGGRQPSTCISVNFAVMGFKTRSSNASLGDGCVNRRLESYDHTCWAAGDLWQPTSLLVHRHNSSWVQTFETERSVGSAVRPFLEAYPQGCAAAVYADFEDASGTCRPRYSRLRALSALMTAKAADTSPAANSLPTEAESVTGSLPTAPPEDMISTHITKRNKMVCFVTPSSHIMTDLPADSCDYLVLSTQNFTAVENVTALFGRWKELMTPLSRKTRLALGMNAHTLVSLYKGDYAGGVLLVESIPSWLKPNGGSALALLTGSLASQDELLLFRILKDLRSALNQAGNPAPEVILAVSSDSELFHKELIELSDVFVLVDHHIPREAGSSSCKVSFPSVSPRTSSLTSPMLIAKDLMHRGTENKTYCISINLAVLKFGTSADNLADGSHCDSEDEVAYSEVCQRNNAIPVYDMNWMTASLRDSKKIYTFEKAEMLLSKVLFLKAWFPSLCVAAFHAELDAVDREACPQSEQYARLLSVRRGLDSSVHGESHWRRNAADGA
ncbi:uncharacterized protein LOC142585834 isoform X1 [Dermacentor variabilis]|uniref:uncharacterized protein LOC142585834 isoform X1 n=2 Tax=Dermacentor variabilis TaxID=34621 RepID=UPI003F5CA5F2